MSTSPRIHMGISSYEESSRREGRYTASMSMNEHHLTQSRSDVNALSSCVRNGSHCWQFTRCNSIVCLDFNKGRSLLNCSGCESPQNSGIL
ncbi:hypothetical protein PISMIDRAFT_676469 [Pisolithus microcarpus 441]|uniref:Uncharacterized protein n=1 Tax=Pisolithus microcarpus 441 TaxID=765257 RepID=A0A0C9YLW5_9AGAM|nr:hypothetical protein PISMIDRAFT_676469 [Pisolithus microcarpus 441]